MNRHERRKAADTSALTRAEMIGMAVAFIGASNDPTISGVTVISPGGAVTYIDADAARKMGPATDGEPRH